MHLFQVHFTLRVHFHLCLHFTADAFLYAPIHFQWAVIVYLRECAILYKMCQCREEQQVQLMLSPWKYIMPFSLLLNSYVQQRGTKKMVGMAEHVTHSSSTFVTALVLGDHPSTFTGVGESLELSLSVYRASFLHYQWGSKRKMSICCWGWRH